MAKKKEGYQLGRRIGKTGGQGAAAKVRKGTQA